MSQQVRSFRSGSKKRSRNLNFRLEKNIKISSRISHKVCVSDLVYDTPVNELVSESMSNLKPVHFLEGMVGLVTQSGHGFATMQLAAKKLVLQP